MAGLSDFIQGLFGNSGREFESGGREYEKYNRQAQDVQQPYNQAGTQAIPEYQSWLQGQKNPTDFINNMTKGYKESPWATRQKQVGMNALNNAGSATGLTGSTPLMDWQQQNAEGIASQDMNQWLSHVLGVNTQYGQGQNNLMTGGQNAANTLSTLREFLASAMGGTKFGETQGRQKDFGSLIEGLFGQGGQGQGGQGNMMNMLFQLLPMLMAG